MIKQNLAPFICWICDSPKMELVKSSNFKDDLTSEDFAITDSHYGTTGEIYKCQNCGFLQCSDLTNVLQFYEQLEDYSYEEGRAERALQAQKLLKIVQKYQPHGQLLDIGAGSGILVEQALKIGYQAEGVEPSKWLQKQAQQYELPVYLGTFPHSELKDSYDIVTVVDVIEHVSNPVNLLSNIYDIISEQGILIVVTPDVDSFMARFLGWKWWHFRIAHIGYFNQNTLNMALAKLGFELLNMKRPTWYFTADYLFERVMKYLPSFVRIPAPNFLKKIIIPLNLGDSLLGIYRRKNKNN